MLQTTLEINITIVPTVSFALSNMGLPIISHLELSNPLDEPIEKLYLKVTSELGSIVDYERGIEGIPASATLVVDCDEILINDALLLQATERSSDVISIEITQNGEIIKEVSEKIEILPFNHWPGLGLPESLAAFSTPNHPSLPGILLRASEILNKWSGSPALDAYQSQNAQRVKQQAAAIFMAIKEKGIVYSEPPANFEFGQRIRMSHTVLDQHLGTCLDLTMLYTSCLEAIGLRPLVFLIKGHAYAGFWLEERSFPEILGSDPTDITNRVAEGVNQIAVVECTHLTNQSDTGFTEAEKAAQLLLLDRGKFQYYLDIYRAHQGGIRPLPLRLADDGQYRFDAPKVSTARGMEAPEASSADTRIAESTDLEVTKTDLWERALLDLSLRNNLLNMRIALRLTPIAAPDLPELEDLLSKGRSFALLPKPSEWNIVGRPDFETACAVGKYTDLLKSELASSRLRTFLTESELSRTLTNLFRVAKSSLEETGSSLLYLSLGALRWYRPNDPDPHYAPLILLPVELTRKSAKSGYSLTLSDDDPQVNISLLELLRRDFGIDISSLNPLPKDEFGVDVQVIFNTFRQKIMQQKGWEVIELSTIGLFSFSQFVMWNDIRSNKDQFLKNDVVGSLIQGRLIWDAVPMRFDYQIDPLDLLLPIPTDASQLFAINESVMGKSFVLHGPPGTGKSQTITGIIANALINKKRVLFVSEKVAALNVVQKRLDALGIGRFCLELHSNKSSKVHVLEQLQQVITEHEINSSEVYVISREKTRAIRSVLDQYAKALHEKNSAGLSLRDQICGYEAFKNAADGISIDEHLLASEPSISDIDERFIYIERLVAAASEMGDLATHPLRKIKGGQFNYGSLSAIVPTLMDFKQAAQSYVEAGMHISQNYHYMQPVTRDEWRNLAEFSTEMLKWKELPASWITEENLPAVVRNIQTLMEEISNLDNYKQSYRSHFHQGYFDLDYENLDASWKAASAESLLKRKKAKQAVIERIQPFALHKISEDSVAFALQTLRMYHVELKTVLFHQQQLFRYLADFISLGTLDQSRVRLALQVAHAVQRSIEDPLFLVPRQMVAGNAQLFAELGIFVSLDEKLQAVEQRVMEVFGDIEFSNSENWIEAVTELCDNLPDHLDALQEWSAWGQLTLKSEELKLESVVKAISDGFPLNEVLPSYKKSLYRAMCMQSFTNDPVTGTFSGNTFNETIRQYKEAEQQQRANAVLELERELESRVPDLTIMARKGSEAALLKRAIRSRGRGISIRELFAQLPELLPRLCPCMLMSPLSVSQYLDFASEPFDMVIFDEASQLQTCKAVGALARAKAAIIVGDPKQMPPTAFFQGQLSDEGFEGIADLESILDDCLALNMPETYLEWHYRSKHESLISFSNTQFYQNKLSTFPSADDRMPHVTYIKVEGHYDGKGENRAEAEAVVSEIKKRYLASKGRHESIGVVTFNLKQQTLIEDLLLAEFYKDLGFEEWTKAGDEPLFVKNLENVQGDERDTILFSITYAPDKEGKMAMRFGPINMDGGWRRLNVAVSRARYEMKVFAVLDPDRIDLSKTGAKGVRSLKSFLEFAKLGKTDINASEVYSLKNDDDIIANEICEALGEYGYKTVKNVGRSAFKVDIAVLEEDNPSETFLAGILLDGATYSRARTTRDREVTQPGMLSALGWETIRVWSIDWWASQKKTLEKILAFLDERKLAVSAARMDQIEEEPPMHQSLNAEDIGAEDSMTTMNAQRSDTTVEIEIEGDLNTLTQASEEVGAELYTEVSTSQDFDNRTSLLGDLRTEYKSVELAQTKVSADEYQNSYDDEIVSRFAQIIELEAPIEKQFLCNRIRESFGIGRSGRNIQERNDSLLSTIPHRETQNEERVFIWRNDQKPDEYRKYRVGGINGVTRSVDQLPYEEILSAMLEVLARDHSLSRDELIRSTASRFGYQRIAARIISVLGNVIKQSLIRKELALTEFGDIQLPLQNG